MTSRVCIMAAGGYKRFELLDENGEKIPKPLAPFDGVPNVARTMRLVREFLPEVGIFISFPKEQMERYFVGIAPFFNDFTPIEGDSSVEGFKFTNIADHIIPETTILYGDVFFNRDDLKSVLTGDWSSPDVVLFGHRPPDVSCIGTKYKEMFAHRINNPTYWLKKVRADFDKRQHKATSWSFMQTLEKDSHRFVSLGPATDDMDYAREYHAMLKYLEEHPDV